MNRRGFLASLVAAIIGPKAAGAIRRQLGKLRPPEDIGISMRVIRGYDIYSDRVITRVDVLYGFAPLQREWNFAMSAEMDSCELLTAPPWPVAKIGDTITIQKPERYRPGDTLTLPVRYHPDAFTFLASPVSIAP